MKQAKSITFSLSGITFFTGFFALFFLLSSNIFSQTYYTVNPNYIKTKKNGNNLLTTYNAIYPDSSVNSVHEFFPRNFSGNVGLPSPVYIFNYGTDNIGFRFYKTPYDNDLFKEKDAEYYRTKGPYASLSGIAGSKQLQIFKLLFTHTYKEKVNVALKFNRYTSQGFYLRQQSFVNNLVLTSNYTNSKKRAGYYFYFLNNGNKNQENGGIKADTLNDSLLTISKELLPVKLTAATRDNKEFRVMFNPWLRLNATSDSSTKLNHYLDVKARFNQNTYRYKDAGIATDKYYTLFYLDTAKTNDSSRVTQFINELNYSLLSTNGNFGFSAGYKNEINRVWQKADSFFVNHIANADLVYHKSIYGNDSAKKMIGFFESKFNLQYVLSGPNSGNYKVESNSFYLIKKSMQHKFRLDFLYENRSADYIYNYWVTNNFSWFNNGYKPQQLLQARVGYDFGKTAGVSFVFQNFTDYLYFDNVAQPRQYAGQLQNIGLTAHYSVVLFKHLGIYLQDVIQSTSNDAYVSAPQNIATARLFYSGNYKDKMQINYGVQAQYASSFYGYAYMPASQMFYLQGRKTTGQYPFVDVYLNARIRPVTIFIKIENALQGLVGSNYSFVPGYYQPDRAFRFGINWLFFD